MQWAKNHDFCIFYNEHNDNFSLEIVDEKYEEVMKTERAMFRRVACSDLINER